MAFDFINPLAAIWKTRGLRHILMPEDIIPGSQMRAQITQTRSQPPAQAARPPQAWPPGPRIAQVEQKNVPERPPVWRPLPVGKWPREWQDRLAKTKKGRIAWSWHQLDADLRAGKSNSMDAESEARGARSRFLHRLLRDFRHPAGTHTFWPGQAFDSERPDADLFWSGLKALACRGTIILGTDYAQELTAKSAIRPFTSERHRGQLIWILPDFNEISENDYDRVLTFLANALRQIVGRA